MIWKEPKKVEHGLGFGGLVEYMQKGKDAERVLFSFCSDNMLSLETAPLEMAATAATNMRCKDPVWHLVYSWREGEKITQEQAQDVINHSIDKMGLHGCEYVVAAHGDTDNIHLHICINKVHPVTTKTLYPSFRKTKLDLICREMEIKHGFKRDRGMFAIQDEEGEEAEIVRVEREDRGVSHAARRYEDSTGEESFERYVKTTVSPLIMAAESWDELHGELSAIGIEYTPKGSGAVLVGRGEHDHCKASAAGRKCAFGQLQKRLGEFEPNKHEVQNVERLVKTVIKHTVARLTWKDYSAARQEYMRDKNEAWAIQKNSEQTRRSQLNTRLKSERQRAYKKMEDGWKDNDGFWNHFRSALAAEQAGKRLELKETIRVERLELKSKFPRRFPTFETWLRQEKKGTAAYRALRYTSRHPVAAPVIEGDASVPPRKVDLRDFRHKVHGRALVYIDWTGLPAFEDQGKRIQFLDAGNPSEDAIRAALQLAVNKWGAVTLKGDEAFKVTALRLAVQEGIRVKNPELQEQYSSLVEARRRQFKFEAPPATQAKKAEVGNQGEASRPQGDLDQEFIEKFKQAHQKERPAKQKAEETKMKPAGPAPG